MTGNGSAYIARLFADALGRSAPATAEPGLRASAIKPGPTTRTCADHTWAPEASTPLTRVNTSLDMTPGRGWVAELEPSVSAIDV
jgi:hypothetical protein